MLRVLVLLVVLASTGSMAQRAQAEVLRVLSYNINYGNTELELVTQLLRDSQADLVALQEVTPSAESHLREALADVFPFMAFYAGQAATGFAFLSRLELHEVHYAVPTHGWFGTYYAEVQLDGRSVQVANVHLLPTLPEHGDGPLSLLGRFMKLEGTRMLEIAEVLAAMPATKPRLVLGDFNTVPGMGSLQLLLDNGFQDSGSGSSPRPNTWTWAIGDWSIALCLDYVLADEQWVLREHRVLAGGASDHFPVLAELELPRGDD